MDTQVERRIDDSELAELRELHAAQGKAFADLGATAYQIKMLTDQQQHQYAMLAKINQAYETFSKRLLRKYQVPEGTHVDMNTGVF